VLYTQTILKKSTKELILMRIKNHSILLICICFLLIVSNGCSTGLFKAQSTPIPKLPGWILVWQDEFEGKAGTPPDASKWVYDLGGEGWGNKEHEYYTNEPANAAMNGKGELVITAIKLDKPAENGLKCWYGPCFYTSARLLTKGKFDFTYGRVEARLKLPYGQGIWPAFWMLGNDIDTASWPNCGEIDIMEHVGKEPDIIHGTVHGQGYSGANGFGGPYVLKEGNFSDTFHVFSIEWEPQEIRWYIDGHQYFSVNPDQVNGKWAFDHPFFLILNLAVGGQWPGYPDARTVFPQTLQVDYVRVYQK
jgi:beta-glucanase (GH16 family)